MNKVICALTAVLVLGSSATASPGQGDVRPRLHASEVQSRPAAVTPWDSNSPQALFRIDKALYQKDGDFFYRVIDDVVTIRLADSVQDWNGLLQRVRTGSPSAFAALEAVG